MSVDIVIPQPAAEGRPAFRARKITTGTIMPPRPANTGRATRRRCRSSPQVELPPGLQPDNEEEERHQAAVDPFAQRQGETDVPDPNRQRSLPDHHVGRGSEVGPDERRHRRQQQYAGAARLGLQKRTKRGLQAATTPSGQRKSRTESRARSGLPPPAGCRGCDEHRDRNTGVAAVGTCNGE